MKKDRCSHDCVCYIQEKYNMKSENLVCVCYRVKEEDNMHNQRCVKEYSRGHWEKEENKGICYQEQGRGED